MKAVSARTGNILPSVGQQEATKGCPVGLNPAAKQFSIRTFDSLETEKEVSRCFSKQSMSPRFVISFIINKRQESNQMHALVGHDSKSQRKATTINFIMSCFIQNDSIPQKHKNHVIRLLDLRWRPTLFHRFIWYGTFTLIEASSILDLPCTAFTSIGIQPNLHWNADEEPAWRWCCIWKSSHVFVVLVVRWENRLNYHQSALVVKWQDLNALADGNQSLVIGLIFH